MRSVARALALGSAITLGIVVLFYLPWVHGLETLGPVLYWVTGPRLNDFWPEPALRGLAGLWARGFGLDPQDAFDLLLAGFKLIAKVGLIALIGWELRNLMAVARADSEKLEEAALTACARIFIFFLLFVNTWIMPWYYAWPLALASPLGWQSTTARICAALGLTSLIVMYQRQIGFPVVNDWGGLTLVLPILLGLAPGVWKLALKHRRFANVGLRSR